MRSDSISLDRPGAHDVADGSRNERAKVESTIEAESEGDQVEVDGLAVVLRTDGTGRHGPEITRDRPAVGALAVKAGVGTWESADEPMSALLEGDGRVRQWQLRALQQAARGPRGLVPGGVALKELACASADDTVIDGVTTRTAKSTRPTHSIERLGALHLATKAVKELGNRHAVLELDDWEVHRRETRAQCKLTAQASAAPTGPQSR